MRHGVAQEHLQRGDFSFFSRLQVRWAEVDAQAVVFNAHYLTYLDTAMSAYWRALALPWDTALDALGGDVFLRKTELQFHAPARADDWLDIGLRCARIGRSSITMSGGIFRADTLLARAGLVYVFVDAHTRRPQPVPQVLRALFQALDGGAPVLQVRVGSWAELGASARSLREAVFVQEQGIAREDEWDAADADAVHAVAFNGLGQAVATARMLLERGNETVAHVGRVAVLRSLRGAGHGLAVMAALEQAAATRGIRVLQLNAQQSAAAFYQRLGYVAEGQPFSEVGIPHVSMRKQIAG